MWHTSLSEHCQNYGLSVWMFYFVSFLIQRKSRETSTDTLTILYGYEYMNFVKTQTCIYRYIYIYIYIDISAYGAHIFGRRFSWQHFLSFLSYFFWGVTWHLASPIGREVFKYEWLRFLNSDIFLRVLRIWNNIPFEISWDVLGVFSDPQAFFKRKFTRSEAWSPALGYLSFYPSFSPSFDFETLKPICQIWDLIHNPWMISYSNQIWKVWTIENPHVFQGSRTFNFSVQGGQKTWTFHGMPSIFFRRLRFVGGWFWVTKSFGFSWKSGWKAFETRIGVLKGSEAGLFWTMCLFLCVTFFVNALLQKGPNLRYQIAIEKGNQLNGTK